MSTTTPPTWVFSFLAVLVLFASLARGQNGPALVNSSRYYQESRIVSSSWKVVPLALDFDQDLYLNEGLLCPYSSESCSQPTCTPCDWTQPDQISCAPEQCCGPALDSSSNTEENLREWCDPSEKKFERLDLYSNSTTPPLATQSSVHSLSAGEWAYFRFFLPAELLCAPVRVAVRMMSGNTYVYISNRFALPSADEMDDQAADLTIGWGFAQTFVDLCPNYDPYYSPGTYAVAVQAVFNASFYVELIVGPTSTVRASPAYTCAEASDSLPADFSCVDDGATLAKEFVLTDDGDAPLYQIAMPVDEGCHVVTFSAFPDYDAFVEAGTDPDVYCAPGDLNASSATMYNALAERWRTGTDTVTFAFCVEQPAVVLCAVQGWTPGPMLITWSTTAYVLRVPIAQPSRYEFGVSRQPPVQLFYTEDLGFSAMDWGIYDSQVGFPFRPARNPLFFFPAPFIIDTRFETISFTQPSSSSSSGPNSYQFSPDMPNRAGYLALLEYNVGFPQVVLSLDELLDLGRLFFVSLTNADGIPPRPSSSSSSSGELFFSVAVRDIPEQMPACDAEQYALVLAQLTDLADELRAAVTVEQVLQLRYEIDVIQAAAPFQSCTVELYSMLDVRPLNTTLDLELCPYDSGTMEYLTHPCCVLDGTAFGCCVAQPTLTTIDTYTVPSEDGGDDTNTEALSFLQQCSSSECARSYFGDLASALNVTQTQLGCPETALSDMNDSADQIIAIQRRCRVQVGLGADFAGNPCRTDADCASAEPYQCNMSAGTCHAPQLANASLAYVRCFVASMPQSFADWLVNEAHPELAGLATDSAAFLDAVLALVDASDCLGRSAFDMSTRSRWVYSTGNPSCEASVFSADNGVEPVTSCGPVDCLDQSCYVQPNQCLRYCIAKWRYQTVDQADCPTNDTVCTLALAPEDGQIASTSSSSSSSSSSFCDEQLEGEYFCAYCPPDGSLPCTIVDGYTEQGACESAIICETPAGEWITGLTSDECTATAAACSVDCLLSSAACSSYLRLEGVCQFTSATTDSACGAYLADGAEFVDEGRLSTTIEDATACAAAGGSWQTCSSLASCDVLSPAGAYLQCLMSPWGACEGQDACEAAGNCNDREYTISYDDASATLQLAACFSSGYVQEYAPDASTECSFTHQRSPNGCLTTVSESDCYGYSTDSSFDTTERYEWRTAALTEAECLRSDNDTGYGCLMQSVRENRTVWYEASTTCTECGGVPASPWQWQAGQWTTAQPRSLHWVKAETVPMHTWSSSAVNFDVFSQWARQYAEYRVSFGLRSSGICALDLLTAPLSALACSCLPAEAWSGVDCFASSNAVRSVGLARPCVDEETRFRTPSSLVTFFSDSLSSLCTIVSTGEIAEDALAVSHVRPSVSFQLAVGRQPSGVVQNAGRRVVGQLNSNGIQLDFDNLEYVDYFELCLVIVDEEPTDSAYTVPDFGSSSDLQVVIPMGTAIWHAQTDDGQSVWCANITREQMAEQPALFAVFRAENYQDGSFDEYTQTETALSYTLGALFCIVLVVVPILALQLYFEHRFRFFIYLFAVPLFFCLAAFRVVYGFALPSGTWDNNRVAGFIVFELPSFIYFSACCCVVLSLVDIVGCFWDKFRAKGRFVVIVLLTCAWCLFVAVAIADGVLENRGDGTSPCPGRVPATSDIDSKLRTLSIVYQSILISLTFLLTMFVLFLEFEVFRNAMSAHDNAKSALVSLKEMLKDGVTISFGFLARCILFIVYLAEDLSSPTYIFVTIVVTELVVIVFLCFFWFFRFSSSRFSSTTSRESVGSSHSGHQSRPESMMRQFSRD